MKFRLIGVLQQGQVNTLSNFTMTEDHHIGFNHFMEAIHRFLQNQNSQGSFPSTLYVKIDNCTRENESRYMFAYFESFVSSDVSSKKIVYFFPVGHTHDYIDQKFSWTSKRLRIKTRSTWPIFMLNPERPTTLKPRWPIWKNLNSQGYVVLGNSCMVSASNGILKIFDDEIIKVLVA